MHFKFLILLAVYLTYSDYSLGQDSYITTRILNGTKNVAYQIPADGSIMVDDRSMWTSYPNLTDSLVNFFNLEDYRIDKRYVFEVRGHRSMHDYGQRDVTTHYIHSKDGTKTKIFRVTRVWNLPNHSRSHSTLSISLIGTYPKLDD